MNTGLIGYKEAAEIIGLPIGTLYALVSDKKIPHKRLGKRLVRFSLEEIRVWISQHSVEQKTDLKRQPSRKKSA